MAVVTDVGSVAEFGVVLRWRVMFPEFEYAASSGFSARLGGFGLLASDLAQLRLRSAALVPVLACPLDVVGAC
jgi:hypothetical protein